MSSLSLFTIQQFIFLFISLSFLHALISHFLRRRSKSPANGGPPTYPIIGCLISFYQNRRRLLTWYTQLLNESPTQTIIISRLGARRTIVTANPENVEYILKSNFDNFPKGNPFTEILGDFLGIGIFNVDGELWHTQRKLASHEFSARSLRDYVLKVIEDDVNNKLLPVLSSVADDYENGRKRIVDLQDLLKKLAFDIVCKVSLGFDPSVSDSSSGLAGAFDAASAYSAIRGAEPVAAVWKMKRMFGIGTEKKLKEAVEEIHSCMKKIIKEKKEKIELQSNNNNNKDDLLHKMIMAGKEEDELRDMAISFVMAGRDTTSSAMTWLFWLLSNHPKAVNEIVREAEQFMEMSSHYDGLKEMKFLEACLCESMRLYPPVAWDSKHAAVDDVLPDGTPVNGGDRVTYTAYGMGRMVSLWGEDRMEFKPERWVAAPENGGGGGGGGLKKVSGYKFPVFQAGPRICLGKEMAFLQMKYVMGSILRRFEIIAVKNEEEPLFVPLLTAHMAGGLQVYVKKR
ncbi:cytochrome P450 94B3-like [Impatiens glandulifera]|uniref:cytochrome P450 94B3-like n=1 Tax=Impatiens glandulifera TaxID=253017 RepID=UPI001FB08230|nr:cytochrome P450 94B3-like [Impatiens glandulifera]